MAKKIRTDQIEGGSHIGKYVGVTTIDPAYSAITTADLNILPLGNYMIAVSQSASNLPNVGSRSMIRFGARSENDLALSSDIMVGTTGMAFRNNNTTWKRVWSDSDFTQASINNWNASFSWGDFRQFGLGRSTALNKADLNTTFESGMYSTATTAVGTPTPAESGTLLSMVSGAAGGLSRGELFIAGNNKATNSAFIRMKNTSGAPNSWTEIWTKDNLPNALQDLQSVLTIGNIATNRNITLNSSAGNTALYEANYTVPVTGGWSKVAFRHNILDSTGTILDTLNIGTFGSGVNTLFTYFGSGTHNTGTTLRFYKSDPDGDARINDKKIWHTGNLTKLSDLTNDLPSALQTLSLGNSGDVSISNGNTVSLSSLSVTQHNDANAHNGGLEAFFSVAGATNYPAGLGSAGGGLKFRRIKDSTSLLCSFDFWKPQTSSDELWLRTGNSVSAMNPWQIVATREYIATLGYSTQTLTAGANITISPTNVISAANTTYATGTAALIQAGVSTTNHVWSPKVLRDYILSQSSSGNYMTLDTPNQITFDWYIKADNSSFFIKDNYLELKSDLHTFKYDPDKDGLFYTSMDGYVVDNPYVNLKQTKIGSYNKIYSVNSEKNHSSVVLPITWDDTSGTEVARTLVVSVNGEYADSTGNVNTAGGSTGANIIEVTTGDTTIDPGMNAIVTVIVNQQSVPTNSKRVALVQGKVLGQIVRIIPRTPGTTVTYLDPVGLGVGNNTNLVATVTSPGAALGHSNTIYEFTWFGDGSSVNFKNWVYTGSWSLDGLGPYN